MPRLAGPRLRPPRLPVPSGIPVRQWKAGRQTSLDRAEVRNVRSDGQRTTMAPSGVARDDDDAPFLGSPALPSNARVPSLSIVGMAATPDGKGYWLVNASGRIYQFGDAGSFGGTAVRTLNKPIVGMAVTPDGKGYWLVASDGGVFDYGDAAFYGSMVGQPLNQPIVGIASDKITGGYWLVAYDGGLFAFHAGFWCGSAGGQGYEGIVAMALNAPNLATGWSSRTAAS
jgi:hypothetical protein